MCVFTRLAKDLRVCWYFAFLFSLAHLGDDLCTFAMYKTAVIIPEVDVSADPAFGPAKHSIEDMNLAITLRTAEGTDFVFTGMRSVILFHRAKVCVAFANVVRMTEYAARFTSIFRWSALSVSGLASASA